ncbi:hypothetical protein FIBSPDRAFT_901610 [Athelia psychrophila]|uniref:Uncharacterized protein n=1 Tax=Athelia psychrophila TaxID=1759441 RepID=A0A165WYQ8_9AGAM|nr:hypothetical protein FIBSPDRAFT_901610 [Fibularhizoctonia sp. CBS 109695]
MTSFITPFVTAPTFSFCWGLPVQTPRRLAATLDNVKTAWGAVEMYLVSWGARPVRTLKAQGAARQAYAVKKVAVEISINVRNRVRCYSSQACVTLAADVSIVRVVYIAPITCGKRGNLSLKEHREVLEEVIVAAQGQLQRTWHSHHLSIHSRTVRLVSMQQLPISRRTARELESFG